MVDYSINDKFDIHFNEWKDFATVDGLEEFEQDVVIQLHDNERDILGARSNSDVAKQKIELAVTRVARQFGVIDSIAELNVSEVRDETASYQVEVTYLTGETFSEEL